MSAMIRPLSALALSLALIACNKSEQPAKPITPAAPATTSPATPAPAVTAPVTTASAGIGVAECDDYLSRYEACVTSKVPDAIRSTLQQSLAQTRDAWRAAAATDAGKQGLAMACKQAHEASKATMQQYGCSDF